MKEKAEAAQKEIKELKKRINNLEAKLDSMQMCAERKIKKFLELEDALRTSETTNKLLMGNIINQNGKKKGEKAVEEKRENGEDEERGKKEKDERKKEKINKPIERPKEKDIPKEEGDGENKEKEKNKEEEIDEEEKRKREEEITEEEERTKSIERQICAFQRNCKYGKICKFLHREGEIATCEQFRRGKCYYGNQCRYSHNISEDRGQEEERRGHYGYRGYQYKHHSYKPNDRPYHGNSQYTGRPYQRNSQYIGTNHYGGPMNRAERMSKEIYNLEKTMRYASEMVAGFTAQMNQIPPWLMQC